MQPHHYHSVLCWCFQGFLSVCNPVAVLEQADELMNTGELAGIPSQVRFLWLDVATILCSNLKSYEKTEVAAVLCAIKCVALFLHL